MILSLLSSLSYATVAIRTELTRVNCLKKEVKSDYEKRSNCSRHACWDAATDRSGWGYKHNSQAEMVPTLFLQGWKLENCGFKELIKIFRERYRTRQLVLAERASMLNMYHTSKQTIEEVYTKLQQAVNECELNSVKDVSDMVVTMAFHITVLRQGSCSEKSIEFI
uniref:CULLIN_2 domain-containing protein n=1 Tax=Heterorhabditis bacteriophora TaxID=37862 RepID=A0A1I7WZE7_HETBA